jgi:hypothetical protein
MMIGREERREDKHTEGNQSMREEEERREMEKRKTI